jgi:hypothetical protein
MSADSFYALSVCINRTMSDARAFQAQLEVCFAAPGYSTNLANSERELELGRSARQFAIDLQSLEGADLSSQTELGINALRPLFRSLIERWKWERVIGPDGESFLAEQLEGWRNKRRSYLSAVRSHVKGHAMGKISDRPSEGYFYTAKDAEREMISPCEPLVESEEELERIHRIWIFSPYLGPEFPTRTVEDFTTLAQAVRDIQEGIRGTPLDALETERRNSIPAPEAPNPPLLPPANEEPVAPATLIVAPKRPNHVAEPRFEMAPHRLFWPTPIGSSGSAG